MKLQYGWVVVAAGALLGCVAMGSTFSLAVFLQPMSEATGWSRTGISLAMTLVFINMGVGGFFWGALTDRFGPRIVVLYVRPDRVFRNADEQAHTPDPLSLGRWIERTGLSERAGRSAVGCVRGIFVVEQPALDLKAPAEPAQGAIGAHHSVTRHEQCRRVPGACRCGGSDGCWSPGECGVVGVRDRLAG